MTDQEILAALDRLMILAQDIRVVQVCMMQKPTNPADWAREKAQCNHYWSELNDIHEQIHFELCKRISGAK